MIGAPLDRALAYATRGRVTVSCRPAPPKRRRRRGRRPGEDTGALISQPSLTKITPLIPAAQSICERLSLTTGSAPLRTCASGGVCGAADVAPSGQ